MAERRINIKIVGYKEAASALNSIIDLEKKLTAIEKEHTKQSVEQKKQAKAQAEETRAELQKETNERKLAIEAKKKEADAERASEQAKKAATKADREKLAAAEKARKETERLTKETQKATEASLAWAVAIANNLVNRGLNLLTRSLREALKEMKAVDDELVTIRKVTGIDSSAANALAEQAYETASKYGVAASDYLSSVAQFSRAGYKELAPALGELAVKTQLVGDMSEETANQFLLSMDAAYKYGGSIEKLSKVLDGANEIDNKFATSLEKITSGLGIIAPVAALTNTSEAEIAAAVGTITAVTQRSGTEAARALRALWLSIVKDTSTEIDDGETVTQEAIDSIADALNKYASESVRAAQAAGKVINPMEALISLNKAYKEDLLTEQELTNILFKLGGKLRASQLVALVQNIDMYERMLGEYKESAGSAEKEIENAMDSWTRKLNQLKNSWTELVSETINTEFIKDILDIVKGVVKYTGDFKVFVGEIAGLVAVLKAPALSSGFNHLITLFSSLKSGVMGTATAMGVLSASVGGLILAVSLLAQGINAISRKIHEEREEHIRAAEAVSAQNEELLELYKTYSYEELLYKRGVGDKESLKAATEELSEALGLEKEEVDKLSGSYDELHERLKTATEDSLRDGLRMSQIALDDAKAELKSYLNGIKGGLGTGRGEIEFTELFSAGFFTATDAEGYSASLKALGERYDAAKKTGNKAEISILGDLYEGLRPLVDTVGDIQESVDGYTEALENNIDATGEHSNAIQEQKKEIASVDGYVDALKDKYEALTKAQDEMNESGSLSVSTYQKIKQEFPELAEYITTTKDGYLLAADAVDLFMQKQIQNMGVISRVNALAGETVLANDATTESILKKANALLIEYRANMLTLTTMQELGMNSSADDAALKIAEAGVAEAENIIAMIEAFQGASGILKGDSKSSGSGKSSANSEAKKAAQAQKKAEIDAIQAQIDALKATKKSQDDNNVIEEKQLAVEEAELALLNEQNERNVRYYNASTGQWEWEANRKAVDDAKENLEKAREALDKEIEKQQFEAQIAELEALKQAAEDKWDAIIDEIENGTKEIVDAINSGGGSHSGGGGSSYTPDEDTPADKTNYKRISTVTPDAAIKIVSARSGAETGLGSAIDDYTSMQLLTPALTNSGLKAIIPPPSKTANASTTNNSHISTHNGDIFQIGDISLDESWAKSNTLYQFSQYAKGLAIFSN